MVEVGSKDVEEGVEEGSEVIEECELVVGSKKDEVEAVVEGRKDIVSDDSKEENLVNPEVKDESKEVVENPEKVVDGAYEVILDDVGVERDVSLFSVLELIAIVEEDKDSSAVLVNSVDKVSADSVERTLGGTVVINVLGPYSDVNEEPGIVEMEDRKESGRLLNEVEKLDDAMMIFNKQKGFWMKKTKKKNRQDYNVQKKETKKEGMFLAFTDYFFFFKNFFL